MVTTGIIGLGTLHQNITSLNHEYGHTVQLENKGIWNYVVDVVIPSLTTNILRRMNKLPYDYNGAPWEAEADALDGVNRTYNNTSWPNGSYDSYWDLIKLFWQ